MSALYLFISVLNYKTCAGLWADAQHIATRARSTASQYKDTYKTDVPGKMLTDQLAQYMEAYTLYGSVRPFGTSVLIASMDKSGPCLYSIEPSGVYYVNLCACSYQGLLWNCCR